METTISNPDHAGTLRLPKTSATEANDSYEAANSSYATADGAAPGVHETVQRVAAKAAAMADDVADTSVDLQAPQVAKFDDLMKSEWAETVRNEVREHPLAMVGIALIAGLVIGRL